MVNVLLSYPRSANSWVRYFVEVVTDLPSCQATFDVATSNVIKPDALIHSSIAKPASIVKRHRFDFEWDNWDESRDSLVVLVRNYRECIIRNNICNDYSAAVESYTHIIDSYHKWSGRKLLVYYEDLILHPIQSFEKISKFLELDEAKSKLFYKELPAHKQRSIVLYLPGSVTQGAPNKLHFHSNRIKSSARQISALINQQPKELLFYIERYK